MAGITFINQSGSAKQVVKIGDRKPFDSEAKSKSGLVVDNANKKVTIVGMDKEVILGSEYNGYAVVVNGTDNRATINGGITVPKLTVDGVGLRVVVDAQCIVKEAEIRGTGNRVEFSPGSKIEVLNVSGVGNRVNTPGNEGEQISVIGTGNKINEKEMQTGKQSVDIPPNVAIVNGVEVKIDGTKPISFVNSSPNGRGVFVDGKKIA